MKSVKYQKYLLRRLKAAKKSEKVVSDRKRQISNAIIKQLTESDDWLQKPTPIHNGILTVYPQWITGKDYVPWTGDPMDPPFDPDPPKELK